MPGSEGLGRGRRSSPTQRQLPQLPRHLQSRIGVCSAFRVRPSGVLFLRHRLRRPARNDSPGRDGEGAGRPSQPRRLLAHARGSAGRATFADSRMFRQAPTRCVERIGGRKRKEGRVSSCGDNAGSVADTGSAERTPFRGAPRRRAMPASGAGLSDRYPDIMKTGLRRLFRLEYQKRTTRRDPSRTIPAQGSSPESFTSG